jgi:predicted nucleic acid-binding protein
MTKILVDTDIMIDFLRGKHAAVAFIREKESVIALSAITVAELFAGVRDDKEMAEIDSFLSLFPVVQVDTHTAKLAGVFKRDYGPSHGTGLADGIIAATARVYELELHTLNVRHYPMFPALKPPY